MRQSVYKNLLIFLVISAVGGWCFLAVNTVLAETCYVCCCGNGQINTGAVCATTCEGFGGVVGAKAYTCGSFSTPEYSECATQAAAANSICVGGCPAGANCTVMGCICPNGSPPQNGTCDNADDPCGGFCGVDEICDPAGSESGGPACVPGSGSGGTNDCNGGPACNDGEECTADGCMPITGAAGTGTGSNNNRSGGTSNVSLPNFLGVTTVSELILRIVNFLMILAIPFAVAMLVWAGFLFATAQGNDEKIKKAKQNLIWTITGIFIILAASAIVAYVQDLLGGGGGQGTALVNKIKDVLNQIIGLLFILVTVYFFWGIITYVRAGGEEKAIATGKKHMIWGLVGMTIMAAAWGIVAIIQQFIG